MNKEEKQKLLDKYILDELSLSDIKKIIEDEEQESSLDIFLTYKIKDTLQKEASKSFNETRRRVKRKRKIRKWIGLGSSLLVLITIFFFFIQHNDFDSDAPSKQTPEQIDENSLPVLQAQAANIKLKQAFKSGQTAGAGSAGLNYYETRKELMFYVTKLGENADRYYYRLAILELYHPLGDKNKVLPNFKKSEGFEDGRDKVPTHIKDLFSLYEDAIIVI